MTGAKGADDADFGRLDRPPPPGAYLDLPESFGRRFTVSVDTEEEFDWTKPFTRDRHGTTHMRRLSEAHRRLADGGVKPLYLVDYPIAVDPASVAVLRQFVDAGEASIGTQLHPWVNPPFDEEITVRNSFVGNLPEALEQAKLLRLTEALERAFGRRPTVYRAGRYGIGPHTARLLAEAGYEVDVSIRPLHDYRVEGGPDFTAMEPRPYRVGRLIEVPLSTVDFGLLRRWGRPLYRAAGKVPRGRGLLSRGRLLTRVALTPEGVPLAEAKRAIERLLDDGVRLLSLSWHSPSVEPGHTPYVRDDADLACFYRWWDGVLDLLAARGVAPASIEEILAACRRGRAA
ncbi:MAG TPA: polysaccharide deacetylase family protein [Allosphingosinicella sp.]|nr:polysaccharide deacetylase family protein [Allosphingosinicella sp.]HYG30952.1 polysaccharide deacetylase family protein [Allosphingosinicella sp.]